MINLKSRPHQVGLLVAAAVVISILLLAFRGGGDKVAEPARRSGPAPAKTEAADYTKYLVDQAIGRYNDSGLQSTLTHYNNPDNVDGPWYVFIIDEDDTIVGHYDPTRRGEDIKGPVGTDINGYVFGQQMLAADGDGTWVPYIYTNPSSGSLSDQESFEFKNAWVVRHDELLFGSGWYIDTDEFAPQLIAESAEHFRTGGLEATLAFYNDPQGVSSGLIPVAQYYNSTETLDGFFSGFIADPDGKLLAHINPDLIGTDIEDLLGPAVSDASADGSWITAEDNPDGQGPKTMRVWFVRVDDHLIGAGWYKAN